MRRALIVYESPFGDAALVARAVAASLSHLMPVETVRAAVAPADLDDDVGLLVVGGPNDRFGLPWLGPRQLAQRDFGAVDLAAALRDWLGAVTLPEPELPAAAFDLRPEHPTPPRHTDAARSAERALRELGCDLVAPAEHFFLAAPTGPLREGEPQRAARWGRALAERVRVVPGYGPAW